jgi:hypothetical protein
VTGDFSANEGFEVPWGEMREDGKLEAHWKGKDYILTIKEKT